MFNYSLCIACSGIFRWLRCLLLPNLLCHVRARLLVIKRLIHHRLSYSHPRSGDRGSKLLWHVIVGKSIRWTSNWKTPSWE
ncbi:hypothetical protein OIU74_017455 [Salix koriyanagi]|uniref:Secreted protein n=1 Tax=Salix koriyanagi TaxID=2511006 RepID=A0A9Q0WQL3_9ROSI|nr:hypothetical protein OIU74_017455 [Salix koriyanagi]